MAFTEHDRQERQRSIDFMRTGVDAKLSADKAYLERTFPDMDLHLAWYLFYIAETLATGAREQFRSGQNWIMVAFKGVCTEELDRVLCSGHNRVSTIGKVEICLLYTS